MPDAQLLRLPSDPAARRERKWRAMCAEQDRLEAEIKALRQAIVPVQRQVSLDLGYPFTVSRDKLELAMKRGKP